MAIGTALPSGLDFENKERAQLLSVIDQFRELGLSEDTSLPQLVVVGDQSSGKSSLLEGLTGIPFPVATDLCTRFATQIVLRRSNEATYIRVSIIPGPESKANEDTKRKLLEFSREFESEDGFDFGKVLEDAAECMGLPPPGSENVLGLKKRFSDDVLKIEYSAPQHADISVVDVPGLFHTPTNYQTEDDRQVVRQLINGYIHEKRAINLAVMEGRNQLTNQEVFNMVLKADPEGLRTVGVITKLDIVTKGERATAFNIASNKVKELYHGWFVVKNRSPEEIEDGITIEGRHLVERRFFDQAPWNRLEESRRGARALKVYLGNLLYDHVRAEFPDLVSEIRKLRAETSEELEKLGQPRASASEQRRYLTRLAIDYQATLEKVLTGIYPEDLEEEDPLKLRMHLHARNEIFGEEMTRSGHTRPFKTIKDELDPEYIVVDGAPEQGSGDADGEHVRVGDGGEAYVADIYEWTRKLYRNGRGIELAGTVNQFLIPPAFREQSKNWHGLASEHIDRIYKVVDCANQKLFARSVTNPTVRSRIERRLADSLDECNDRAVKKLAELIADERTGIPQTVNHYFAETLDKIRTERVIERFKVISGEEHEGTIDAEKLAEIKSIVKNRLSNEEQAVYDIHDTLKSYYKVALKRFVDNVVVQVVERVFITEGPLKIFNAEYIASMSEAELGAIAAEDFQVASRRRELDGKIARLDSALKIARQFA